MASKLLKFLNLPELNAQRCVVGLGLVGTLANIEDLISTFAGGNVDNRSFPQKCISRILYALEFCPLQLQNKLFPIFKVFQRKCYLLEQFDIKCEHNTLNDICLGRRLSKTIFSLKTILGRTKINIFEYEGDIPEEILRELYDNIGYMIKYLENLLYNADMTAQLSIK